jgi:hypothetical protein
MERKLWSETFTNQPEKARSISPLKTRVSVVVESASIRNMPAECIQIAAKCLNRKFGRLSFEIGKRVIKAIRSRNSIYRLSPS